MGPVESEVLAECEADEWNASVESWLERDWLPELGDWEDENEY